MTDATPTAPAAPEAATPPTISPHVRFTEVRTRLLDLERDKRNGIKIDLKEVQSLVSEMADLTAAIQTTTTGPKKPKAEAGEKAPKKAAASKKKTSSIAHLNIPEGDDF